MDKVVYHYRRGSSEYQSPLPTLQSALEAAWFDLEATEEPWKSTEPIKIVVVQDGNMQEYSPSYILEQAIFKAAENADDTLD